MVGAGLPGSPPRKWLKNVAFGGERCKRREVFCSFCEQGRVPHFCSDMRRSQYEGDVYAPQSEKLHDLASCLPFSLPVHGAPAKFALSTRNSPMSWARLIGHRDGFYRNFNGRRDLAERASQLPGQILVISNACGQTKVKRLCVLGPASRGPIPASHPPSPVQPSPRITVHPCK